MQPERVGYPAVRSVRCSHGSMSRVPFPRRWDELVYPGFYPSRSGPISGLACPSVVVSAPMPSPADRRPPIAECPFTILGKRRACPPILRSIMITSHQDWDEYDQIIQDGKQAHGAARQTDGRIGHSSTASFSRRPATQTRGHSDTFSASDAGRPLAWPAKPPRRTRAASRRARARECPVASHGHRYLRQRFAHVRRRPHWRHRHEISACSRA